MSKNIKHKKLLYTNSKSLLLLAFLDLILLYKLSFPYIKTPIQITHECRGRIKWSIK
jgi:hypothetical protein